MTSHIGCAIALALLGFVVGRDMAIPTIVLALAGVFFWGTCVVLDRRIERGRR